MKKIIILFMILLIPFLPTACQGKKKAEIIKQQDTAQRSVEEKYQTVKSNGKAAKKEVQGSLTAKESAAGGITEKDGVEEIKYSKNGIEAVYPQLISGADEGTLKKWNQIIERDFNKLLDLYSFSPFPELTPEPGSRMPVILIINYEMKLNDNKWISILYHAAYNSKYSAHPTELVYTTNISKGNNERLKLTDIIEVNEAFVKDFRNWDFISPEPDNTEMNKAIKDYIDSLSDEDLLKGFQTADTIGSGNLWGIYSYQTPDRLGISLEVPNYIGDHVEFEREYSKI